MEAGSKNETKVIGARDLKSQFARYLLQGLVMSVFLHSTIIALVGFWPREAEQLAGVAYDDTIVVNLPPIVPERQKKAEPARAVMPTEPKIRQFVPKDVELLTIDSLLKPENPDLANLRGPADSSSEAGISGFDDNVLYVDSAERSGVQEPWKEFVYREVDPVALNDINPQPGYPEMARKAGVNGSVHVWVLVGEKGEVRDWHVVDVKPVGLGFEDEVARVIPRWRFTPALQDNRAVAVWVAIPFKFRVSN